MRLLLLHAEVAHRSCADCQTYQYLDRGPGQFAAAPMTRGGKVTRRVAGSKTPCAWCPKVAPGDPPEPESAQDLSAKNRLAYLHYLECSAVGSFPADAIVRRNAAVIRGAEEAAEKVERARGGLVMLGTLLKGL